MDRQTGRHDVAIADFRIYQRT